MPFRKAKRQRVDAQTGKIRGFNRLDNRKWFQHKWARKHAEKVIKKFPNSSPSDVIKASRDYYRRKTHYTGVKGHIVRVHSKTYERGWRMPAQKLYPKTWRPDALRNRRKGVSASRPSGSRTGLSTPELTSLLAEVIAPTSTPPKRQAKMSRAEMRRMMLGGNNPDLANMRLAKKIGDARRRSIKNGKGVHRRRRV